MKLKEETTTDNVAMPTGMLACGTPYFKCNDNMFFSLHLKARKNRGWFNKHYKDTNVAGWARKNKGKGFYLKHEDSGMFRKIKAS